MKLSVCGCVDFRYGEANGQLKKERELVASQRKKEIKETHVCNIPHVEERKTSTHSTRDLICIEI